MRQPGGQEERLLHAWSHMLRRAASQRPPLAKLSYIARSEATGRPVHVVAMGAAAGRAAQCVAIGIATGARPEREASELHAQSPQPLMTGIWQLCGAPWPVCARRATLGVRASEPAMVQYCKPNRLACGILAGSNWQDKDLEMVKGGAGGG